MTTQDLNTLVTNRAKVIFIDVRQPSEYMRLNIGGNRLTISEAKTQIDALKRLYTEGYQFVVGCVYHDSQRLPDMLRWLRSNGIECQALFSSRATGGGIIAYSNRYFRKCLVPKVKLTEHG